MSLLSIEHSKTARRADFALYAAAVIVLAGWHCHGEAGCYGVTTSLWDRVCGSTA
jgi:hypothetical protein